MKHLNILIRGKVQGVFFRASAADVARALGLNGFVRNQPDGTVYIEVEGAEAVLNDFTKWCRNGPPAARVEECEISEGAIRAFTNFEIQR